MFKKETVLDVTDLPAQVKNWAYHGIRDCFSEYSNGSYHRITPGEVLVYDEEQGCLTGEFYTQEFWEANVCDSEAMYNFLRWCIEQGQTDDFLLLYWW